MKKAIPILFLILFSVGAAGQSSADKKQQDREKKERAKQQERDRKQEEKQARQAYYQRLAQPPVETFPVNANLTGQCITKAAQEGGFVFAGYQPAGQVFGAETAQMAIYTSKLTWSEAAATGLSIGALGARSLGDPFKFVAFVISEKEGKGVALGKVGIACITTAGWYYKDLTSVENQRLNLSIILHSAQNEAEKITSQRQEADESNLQVYQKIKIGMSFKDVVDILGTGKLVSETETTSLRTAVYEWPSRDMTITLTFENDKLTKKAQAQR